MPITTPVDRADVYGGDGDHFGHVLEHLFVPAIEAAGFEAVRPAAQGADLIHAEIVRNLETADLVLCDISCLNPNVFFELGIRTALNRPMCLVRDSYTSDVPFDAGVLNFHMYSPRLAPWELQSEIDRLTQHLTVTTSRSDGHNGLWQKFGLTQQGTEAIRASANVPEGAAMAVLLEEIRGLRNAVDVREHPPIQYGSRGVDKPTRAIWVEAIVSDAEPYGAEIMAFVRKSQEVAANDGVCLRLVGVADQTVALQMSGEDLSPRGHSLIVSLARSYGVEVGFVPAT